MKLDLTNLGSEEMYSLNAMAEKIKPIYLDVLSQISESQEDLRLWYINPFACRNTIACKSFDAVVRYFFVEEQLKSDKGITEVIVRDYHNSHALKKLVEEEGVYTVLYKESRIWKTLKPIYNTIAFILWGTLHSIALYLASIKNKKNKIDCVDRSDRILVGETIYYKGTISTDEKVVDRHFGTVFDELSNSYGGNIIIFPLLYGFFDYFHCYRAAMKSGKRYIFLPQLVVFSDYLKVLSEIRFSKIPEFSMLIDGVDFSDLSYKSIKKNRWKMSSMLARLKFVATKRLANRLREKKIDVLRWHEGHEVDQMTLLAWRDVLNQVKIVGYYDAYPPKNYLCPVLSESDIKLKMLPDVSYSISDGVVKDLEEYVKVNHIKKTGSLRFTLQDNLSQHESALSTSFSVLVVLPMEKSIANGIFEIVSEVIKKESLDCQFILRPHPASTLVMDSILGFDNVVINNNVTFEQLLSEASVVVGSASSALVQGILAGKYVVDVGIPGELSMSPIPSCVSLATYAEVYNAEQLYKTLNTFPDSPDLDSPDKQCLLEGGDAMYDFARSLGR